MRVVTEVAALDRPFDYALTPGTERTAVGDRVRVNLHGRSVRGWVASFTTSELDLKPVVKWLGYGPPKSLVPLLSWAAHRWCAPESRFFLASSPKRIITQLPMPPSKTSLAKNVKEQLVSIEPGVVRLAPCVDPLGLILGAYESTLDRVGSLLVLVPNEAWAQRLRGRLAQRGCAVASGDDEWDRMRASWPVVVGPRGAAFAPVEKVAGCVVIDADDQAFHSEASPTWNAAAVLVERCLNDDAPLWLTSALPSPTLLETAPLRVLENESENWPRCLVLDRRASDPHSGVLDPDALRAAHRALEGLREVAVVVVLQRLGNGRLFACAKCGELARCLVCEQAEEEVDGGLSCADRHDVRAVFCRHCGSTKLRRVRSGVTTLARDVAAQLGCAVSEVTSATDPLTPLARVVVGTEAVWQRVRSTDVVIFVDFDQYLLAPRETARREALLAVAKAGRLVGPRSTNAGVVIVQTRRGDDLVLNALTSGDVTTVMNEEVETAKLLELPPYVAVAEISGEAASTFVAELGDLVRVSRVGDAYVVRAPDIATLTNALNATARPSGKLRIAVY